MSRGKVAEKAPRILTNENIVKRKLKIILPVLANNLSANQNPIEANTQAKMQAPKNMGVFTNDEKSTIYAFAQ